MAPFPFPVTVVDVCPIPTAVMESMTVTIIATSISVAHSIIPVPLQHSPVAMEEGASLPAGTVTSTKIVWMAVMSRTAPPKHPLPALHPTSLVIITGVSQRTGSVTQIMIVKMVLMKRTVHLQRHACLVSFTALTIDVLIYLLSVMGMRTVLMDLMRIIV